MLQDVCMLVQQFNVLIVIALFGCYYNWENPNYEIFLHGNGNKTFRYIFRNGIRNTTFIAKWDSDL